MVIDDRTLPRRLPGLVTARVGQGAQSAVDRFKNNAFDLVVDGESFRARLKPNIEKLGPPPSAPVKKQSIHPRTRAANRR